MTSTGSSAAPAPDTLKIALAMDDSHAAGATPAASASASDAQSDKDQLLNGQEDDQVARLPADEYYIARMDLLLKRLGAFQDEKAMADFDQVLGWWTKEDTAFGSVRATPFVKSVRLMKAMDAFENADALPDGERCHSADTMCQFFLNCEYQLYKLNASTPLAHNIALSFWLKTLIKWGIEEAADFGEPRLSRAGAHLKNVDEAEDVLDLRATYVRHILGSTRQQKQVLHPGTWTKETVLADPDFELEPFVDALKRQGIQWTRWYKDLTPHMVYFVQHMESQTSSRANDPNGASNLSGDVKPYQHLLSASKPSSENGTSTKNVRTHGPDQSDRSLLAMDIDLIVSLANTDPAEALHILTHFTVDMHYMEIINGIIMPTTPPTRLDPAVVASGFVQHGLRLLERFAPGGTASANTTLGPSADELEVNPRDYDNPFMRDNKVSLLCLFIKHLLYKKVVRYADLQYDIQEIITRFAGMRNVREFALWLETSMEEWYLPGDQQNGAGG